MNRHPDFSCCAISNELYIDTAQYSVRIDRLSVFFPERVGHFPSLGSERSCVVCVALDDGDTYFLVSWDKRKPLHPRCLAMARLSEDDDANCTDDTFLFAVGGRSRGNTIGFVDRFSFLQRRWTHAPRLQEPRGSLGVVLNNAGVLFAIAGSGVKSNLATCEYLDLKEPLERQEWKYLKSVEIPRHALAATTTNGGKHVYCVGGWKYGTLACKAVDKLDVEGAGFSSSEWTPCAPMLSERKLHGVASVGNKIYVFGGLTAGSHVPLATAEVYDEGTDTWSRIADLPQAGAYGACAVLGQVYAVVWGMKKFGIFRYNVETDTYEHVSVLPYSNWHGFGVASHASKIYLVGGSESGQWTGNFSSFDVVTSAWEKLPPVPYVRRRLAAAVYSSRDVSPLPRGAAHMSMKRRAITEGDSVRKKKRREVASAPLAAIEEKDCSKLAFVVEYDGAGYHGFQALEDKSLPTVQESLENALRRTTKICGRVAGAGRTDAGVHSTGMVATALVSKEDCVDVSLFSRKLASRLQQDISIRVVKAVEMSFNPRDTTLKHYTYKLGLGKRRALGRQYVWDISCWNIDVDALRQALQTFVGQHDFSAFCDKKQCKTKDNVLTLNSASVVVKDTRDRQIWIEFEAKTFRNRQIRKMVACAVNVSRGTLKLEDMRAMLVEPKDARTPSAPACGLTLAFVRYGDAHPELSVAAED